MAKIPLREGEIVRLAVRSHSIRVVVPLGIATLLVVLAFFLLFPLFAFGWIGVTIFLLAIFLASVVAVRSLILWRSTVFLVTNQRVIDVDRVSLFRWIISDVTYANIADISFEITGPLQMLLGAGNVVVTTISGTNMVEARFVPKPEHVREVLVNEVQAHQQKSPSQLIAPESDDGLEPDDERAVNRYTEHLRKRRAIKTFYGEETQK